MSLLFLYRLNTNTLKPTKLHLLNVLLIIGEFGECNREPHFNLRMYYFMNEFFLGWGSQPTRINLKSLQLLQEKLKVQDD